MAIDDEAEKIDATCLHHWKLGSPERPDERGSLSEMWGRAGVLGYGYHRWLVALAAPCRAACGASARKRLTPETG